MGIHTIRITLVASGLLLANSAPGQSETIAADTASR